MKLITGNVPMCTDRREVEMVCFCERDDVPAIKQFVEQDRRIPAEANFRESVNPQWGDVELEWIWYEVEL